ncbi:MAG: imidazole glycerol phosphate synthase subunit HisH [Elusimicrobiota bacterium]
MIAIIDAGGANFASITNALERLGTPGRLTKDPEVIGRADHVILPGVGAAADSMRRLRETGLVEVIRRLQRPLLGICLGMQLLFARSEEGETHCLGVLPGCVRRMEGGPGLSIPHMGWNRVRRTGSSFLLSGVPDESHFYFAHSYQAPEGPWVRGTARHGRAFPAVVESGNFFGVQFHPERSADAGATILRTFLTL